MRDVRERWCGGCFSRKFFNGHGCSYSQTSSSAHLCSEAWDLGRSDVDGGGKGRCSFRGRVLDGGALKFQRSPSSLIFPDDRAWCRRWDRRGGFPGDRVWCRRWDRRGGFKNWSSDFRYRRSPYHQYLHGDGGKERFSSGDRQHHSFSVFVDGLPKTFCFSELRHIFQAFGIITDIFISRKVRTRTKDTFGFFRFRRQCDGERAIMFLNGSMFAGKRLLVSMARYRKGGTPFSFKPKYPGFSPIEHGPTSSSVPLTNDPPNILSSHEPVHLTGLSQPMMVEKGEKSVTAMAATDIQSTAMAMNKDCVMVASSLKDDPQRTGGDGPSDDSNKLELGKTTGSTHPQKDQLSTDVDSASRVTEQPMIRGKVKRVQNHRDIAMFLGFYSKDPE